MYTYIHVSNSFHAALRMGRQWSDWGAKWVAFYFTLVTAGLLAHCSILQCVAVCCSVMQCFVVCRSTVQRVAFYFMLAASRLSLYFHKYADFSVFSCVCVCVCMCVFVYVCVYVCVYVPVSCLCLFPVSLSLSLSLSLSKRRVILGVERKREHRCMRFKERCLLACKSKSHIFHPNSPVFHLKIPKLHLKTHIFH